MHQVLNSVDPVEHERPCQRDLHTTLDQQRQAGERSRDGGGLEVPAGQRSCQVADAVDVQPAGEDHAREALEDGRAEEGLLLVVDLEVGGDRAVQALLCEEGLRFAGGHGLGGGRAAGWERREGGGEEGRGGAGWEEG